MTQPPRKPSALLPIILVIVAPLVALWPVVSAEFIPLDDPHNVSRNPDFNPPQLRNVGRYWTGSFHNMYAPLTYTTWAGLARLAWMDGPDAAGNRLNPYVFHAANLFVHVANAALVFLLLRRLTAPAWAACAGALLFALHPIQVETVAWVTCLRDLLAAAFALAALLAYVSHAGSTDRRRAARSYALACLLLAAALLCKPIAVVVPLVAAAIDLGVLRRPLRSVAAAAGGLMLVVVPAAIVAKLVQSGESIFDAPPWLRPLVAADAIGFYMYKLFLPIELSMDYGRTPQWLLAQPAKWLALFVPIALAAIAWRRWRRQDWRVVAGVAIFVASLLPVLGLTRFDFQHHSTVADRYAYLPMLGPALILAFAVRRAGTPVAASIGVVLLLLAARSHVQSRQWKDGSSIYLATLAVNPNSILANNGMGLLMGGRPEAEGYFLRALQTRDDPVTAFNLGNWYLRKDRPADAVPWYRIAAERRRDPQVVANLASALVRSGAPGEAEAVLVEALRASPDSAELHANLAAVLARRGDRAGAAERYREALRLDPNLAIAAEELARLDRAPATTSITTTSPSN